MRYTRVWQQLLGVARTVVEGVELDGASETVVVSVRPSKGASGRCGHCGRRAARFDRGQGRRRWRALDVGEFWCYLEADSPRVRCVTHGVIVAQVPWARHGAGHTTTFDDTVAWLAVQCSKSAVVELMRIAWRSVGAIVTRVSADIDARVDRLAGLRRIGIDEISYKRGHRYLTIVVDHDSGRLVWAAAGRDEATLQSFFDLLGHSEPLRSPVSPLMRPPGSPTSLPEPVPKLCAALTLFTWLPGPPTPSMWCAQRRGTKPAVGAASDAASGRPHAAGGTAATIKRARYALWKNPENLTEHQAARLEWIAKTSPRLYRAYLLKEGLRHVFAVKGDAGKEALDAWIGWARRCRIPAFVDLQRKIVRHRAAIDAALEHGLSQALIESTNTKIRLLTRIAFGFRSPQALIALALLALGGHRPHLPGRNAPTH